MTQMPNIVPVQNQSDDALLRTNWKKLTTLSEERLIEAVETYQSLGFEVYAQVFSVDEECTACFVPGREAGKIQGTVWIRAGSGIRSDDELF